MTPIGQQAKRQHKASALSPDDRRLITSFLDAMRAEKGLAANTIAAYDRDLTSAGLALPSQKTLMHASANDLRHVLKIWSVDLTAKTVARKLSALRQFMIFLVAEGIRGDDPSQYLDAPKQPKSLPKSLDESEVTALITTASQDQTPQGLMLMAMLELLYGAGLRVSEMTQLEAAVFNRRNDHITIRGKGGKDRVVMLTNAALDAVESWLKTRDENPDAVTSRYLFPSPKTNDPKSPDQAINRVEVYGLIRQLGVHAGVGAVTPHMLRHSFATHMLNRGADLRSLQVLLGHADISTTEIYTKTRDDRLSGLVHDTHPLARSSDVDV